MTADRLEMIKLQNMELYGFGPAAMKKVKVCTECGHRLPDKTLYDVYKERHRCCPVCDTVLSNEMGYCPQCGRKLE